MLSRIKDSKQPSDVIADKFARCKITLMEKSCLHLVLSVEEEDIEKIEDKITDYVTQKYGKSDEEWIAFLVIGDRDFVEVDSAEQNETVEDGNDDEDDDDIDIPAPSETKNDRDPEDMTLEETLGAVDVLVGAKEFKDLVREIALVAPEIKKSNSYDVFMAQSYLFSLGDGCGLSTYLSLLAKISSTLELAYIASYMPVQEIKLELSDKPKDDLENAMDKVTRYDDDDFASRVICIDISKWIDKSDNEDFRNFIKQVQKKTQRHIFVFRVPFVDKDVLGKIEETLNDLTYVKTVSFPPFDNSETKEIAKRDFERYGMSLTDGGVEVFLATHCGREVGRQVLRA